MRRLLYLTVKLGRSWVSLNRIMEVEPSGITMIGECEIKTEKCVARTPVPVTLVWTPERKQINVCRACLEEQVRTKKWHVEGARVA